VLKQKSYQIHYEHYPQPFTNLHRVIDPCTPIPPSKFWTRTRFL